MNRTDVLPTSDGALRRDALRELPGQRGELGWLLLVCLLGVAGCGRLIPNSHPFGVVKGASSSRSANGLAIHREMWETTGAKVLFPQKLSPRLETVDVIVLVGQTFHPPGESAREWLETWLAKEPGRTVLYFGRDFNAYAYYLSRQIDQVSAEERADVEFVLARTQAVELNARLESIPESTFCGWFYLDAEVPIVDVSRFSGPWSSGLDGLAGTWPVGISLQPPERKWRSRKPSWLTKPAPANPLKAANARAPDDGQSVRRSQWQPEELDTDAKWNDAFRWLPDHEVLLATADQRPLIFRLYDRERWPESQILVVANGAPLLNGSLVEPLHRRISEQLVTVCRPASRVAMLTYGDNGLLISDVPEKDPRGAGLEFLTVWPMSAITMPAALFCILLCVYLWPILGRARSLPKRSVSDFGLHVEALGRMLMDSGDVEFARRSIAEYYERVRQEPPPDWLEQLDGSAGRRAPQPSAAAGPVRGIQESAAATPAVDPPPSGRPSSGQAPPP